MKFPNKKSSAKYVLLSLAFLFSSANIASAVSVSTQNTPTPTDTPTKNVEQIREQVKEKVRERLDEVKQGQKRSYVGKITTISATAITLSTPNGEKQAILSEDTVYVGSTKNPIKFESIKIGDYIIVLGYFNESGALQAKRIILMSKPKAETRRVVFGEISDISPEEKLLVLKKRKNDQIMTIEIGSNTVITKKLDKNVEKVKFTDIGINDWIVAIGQVSSSDQTILTAKIIHVIPGLSNGKKAATVSPTISALSPTPTKKATPTPTKKLTPTPTKKVTPTESL